MAAAGLEADLPEEANLGASMVERRVGVAVERVAAAAPVEIPVVVMVVVVEGSQEVAPAAVATAATGTVPRVLSCPKRRICAPSFLHARLPQWRGGRAHFLCSGSRT